VAVVPVTVDQQTGRVGHRCLSNQHADLVGANLILRWQSPRGRQIHAGRSVVSDEDIERFLTEPGDIVGIGDLVLPPVHAGGAVAPVDGERSTEKPERAATDVEARPTGDVGDVLGDVDGNVAVLELGERGVVVVVAVDEPQLDAVGRAGLVDVRKEARSVTWSGKYPKSPTWMTTGQSLRAATSVRCFTHFVLPWVSPAIRTRRTSCCESAARSIRPSLLA
jgi:hypothetical protein